MIIFKGVYKMSEINFTVTERGYDITQVNKYITMIQQEYANAVAWGEEMERKYEELKKSIDEYFGLDTLKFIVRQPLELLGVTAKYDVIVNVCGGGFTGQAGAIRHGIARALLEAESESRGALKKAGFLTRDSRMKERKKYGLKKARRAPQFSKR